MFESLGKALYALGYTRSLWLSNPDHLRKTAPNNPDAPYGVRPSEWLARYGFDLYHDILGNTVGERFSGDGLVRFVVDGGVPGFLPPSWAAAVAANPQGDFTGLCSDQDRSDAIYFTRSGQSSWYDDAVTPYLRATAPQPPVVTPPPVQPPAPPVDPPKPPPVVEPPAPPQPPPVVEPQYKLADISALVDDLKTLVLIPQGAPFGPNRRARAARAYNWVKSVAGKLYIKA